MEKENSSNDQQGKTRYSEEIMPGIQQELGYENEKRKCDAGYAPSKSVETLWKDFWHIPLKDRLMFWSAFLLVIVGGITLYVFSKQLETMNQTLVEIRR
jgi:hypothetical protein